MCSTGSHENSSGPPTQILESSLDLAGVQNQPDHVFLLALYGYRWRGRSSALWEGILDEKFQEGDVEHG